MTNDTLLAERRGLIFHEKRLFRNVNQVDVARNIQEIKSYGDVFYTTKKILEVRILFTDKVFKRKGTHQVKNVDFKKQI